MSTPGRHPEEPALVPENRQRRTLARKLAYLLAGTNYVPLPHEQFEAALTEVVDELCAAALAEPPQPERAALAGARLVELNCTSDKSLSSTMDVLVQGLLALPELRPVERFAEPVVRVVGALATGYVSAAQRETLEQQQGMHASLLKAVRDAKYNLRSAQARFDEVATSSASGILVTELDGTVVQANGAIAAILGHPPAELTGRNLFDLVHQDYAPVLREDYQAVLDGRTERIKQSQRLVQQNGDPVQVSITASLLRGTDEEPSHFVTVVENDTELVLLQNELSRQALHDVLTGLPNRQYFTTQLETALHQADPHYGLTLLHLDLDAYPAVRDGLGEQVGQQLLVLVAQRLRTSLSGEKAVVARFDGAEFALLLENTPTTPLPASLVHTLRQELAEPAYVGEHGLPASASIGVVHRPPRDREPRELLRDAHLALRRAKAAGPGQWELAHPEQIRRDRELDALAATMPGAFENGAVEANYRPLTRLADGAVHGVEVLLRWNHAELGPLPDERCRELAEVSGLMLPLGEWLLRTGCQQTGWWRRQLGRDLLLTISVTPHQAADSDLVSRVLDVVEETAFPPGRLLVALPSLALTTDLGEARGNLAGLADVGVRTAIRDFGLGSAELAAVVDLPVDAVWLDRALTGRAKLPDSPVTEALRLLPGLVHRAGAEVIVDGLTTADDAGFWLAAAADLGMGALVGRPGRADELAATFGDPRWRS
ncbi:EAL domain-containing protein [Allokutzneria sp. A3M-2-11 16]|uniref:putative bifunctional diguanylate cyclase/phosphodiesterase n=1 Tax=Allokutzneria sp. A3M-2-11 16 TaxID=2962043 RepID=UPI0020B7D920|nr:EAL domain-containing protein [Allokutzneria sp. A3M-2-11 16]MCP3798430.1 EAL domain-containing protein [Allokutzneria sp. A3M-2-11 16]